MTAEKILEKLNKAIALLPEDDRDYVGTLKNYTLKTGKEYSNIYIPHSPHI